MRTTCSMWTSRLFLRYSSIMPVRALRACAHMGCSCVVSYGRYCVNHLHAHAHEHERTNESTRPQSQDRGYDSRWKKYAERFKTKHPICCDSMSRHPGQVRATQQVDHIVPHKGDRKLFWDTTNHQPLCASCGGYKSAVEQGGRAHGTRAVLNPVSGIQGMHASTRIITAHTPAPATSAPARRMSMNRATHEG